MVLVDARAVGCCAARGSATLISGIMWCVMLSCAIIRRLILLMCWILWGCSRQLSQHSTHRTSECYSNCSETRSSNLARKTFTMSCGTGISSNRWICIEKTRKRLWKMGWVTCMCYCRITGLGGIGSWRMRILGCWRGFILGIRRINRLILMRLWRKSWVNRLQISLNWKSFSIGWKNYNQSIRIKRLWITRATEI